jgi:hypothetical protein
LITRTILCELYRIDSPLISSNGTHLFLPTQISNGFKEPWCTFCWSVYLDLVIIQAEAGRRTRNGVSHCK